MKQIYSPSEFILNVKNLFYTKIFWPKARLIRRPFYIRGKSNLNYGIGLTVGYYCRFEIYQQSTTSFGSLQIGENCKFGDRVHISSINNIEIGDNCLLASNILITDNEHGSYNGKNQSSPYEIPDNRKLFSNPVKIGKNCWIGENVVILPGTTIGDGVIVGANSVVKGNFEENTIIGGTPAKVLKIFDKEKNIWKKASDL